MKLPILCAAGLLAISSVACAADNIAVVNGQAIPKSLEDTWVKELVANGGADTPEARAQIKNNLIAGAVIEQEAKKLGIDKSPSIQFGIQYAKFPSSSGRAGPRLYEKASCFRSGHEGLLRSRSRKA